MLVATTFAAAFAREVFFCHDCWYSFWHVDGVCTKNCTTDRISQKTWQQRLHGIWCSLFQSVILVAFLRKRIFAIYGTCTSSRLFVPRLACLLNNLVGPVERKPAWLECLLCRVGWKRRDFDGVALAYFVSVPELDSGGWHKAWGSLIGFPEQWGLPEDNQETHTKVGRHDGGSWEEKTQPDLIGRSWNLWSQSSGCTFCTWNMTGSIYCMQWRYFCFTCQDQQHTLVCPIQLDGCPSPGADVDPGVAIEYGHRGRCRLAVLAFKVGGRWGPATQTFLQHSARETAPDRVEGRLPRRWPTSSRMLVGLSKFPCGDGMKNQRTQEQNETWN